jgi:DNA-binding response OmpR family regulator
MNTSLRFLVVDDELSLQRIGVRALRTRGYECRVASSAFEAIRILEQEPIDVMLTDVGLPGVDGLRLAEFSKARYPQLAVVVISGRADAETVTAARRAGADDFVAKPFQPAEFIAAAARAVHTRTRRRDCDDAAVSLPEAPLAPTPSLDALFSWMS